MIYYKHKESGVMIPHSELKNIINKGHYMVSFHALIKSESSDVFTYNLDSRNFRYDVHLIPFSDDFEVIELPSVEVVKDLIQNRNYNIPETMDYLYQKYEAVKQLKREGKIVL